MQNLAPRCGHSGASAVACYAAPVDTPLTDDSDDAPFGRPFVASETDVALMLRVARGEPRARRTLAQRLVVRVRRAAYALMGPIPEAEEAAVAALTELVRAASTFPSELTLHAWCDRLSCRSVVHFAHAMRAPRAPSEPTPELAGTVQSFEDLLARLPPSTREIFALTHVFGQPFRQVVALVGAPDVAVREELEHARASLMSLLRQPSSLPEPQDIRRFWSAWERARDAADGAPLSAEAVLELRALGPFVQGLLALLAQAETFLDAASGARLTSQDRASLARVLSALATSNSPVEGGGRERHPSSEPPFELDGPEWVPPVCVGLSVLMLIAAFVALGYHEPRVLPRKATPRPALAARTSAVAVPPTIEALPKAATAPRGSPLRRGGMLLEAYTPLYEGDVLRAPEGPACLRIEPATEICIGVGTDLVLTRLARDERTLTLEHGRAVVALEGQAAPVRVLAGSATLLAERGTFGLERDEQGVVLRALLGRAQVHVFGREHELSVGALIARAAGADAERAPLLPEKARRDWELFAAQRPPTGAATVRAGKSAEPDVAAPQPVAEPSAGAKQVTPSMGEGAPAWPVDQASAAHSAVE